jgi:hypothetical protein
MQHPNESRRGLLFSNQVGDTIFQLKLPIERADARPSENSRRG